MTVNSWATLRRALAIVVTLALVLQPNLSPQPRTSAEAAELAAPLASVAAPGFAVTDFATGFPNSGAVGPVGVAFDSNNNLLAMDYANGVLYRFGSLGGVAGATTQVNATPIPGAPSGLAFGKDGHLYLARQAASDVLEINPTTGSIVRTVASGVPCATGIATDPLSGDLFVSTVGCSAIGIMRLSGFASGPATITSYASPGTADGVTFAPDGTLYAAVFGQSIVRIAGTNAPNPGAVTTIANVPSSDGTAVAASSDPSRPPFIFANRNDGIITRIDLTTTPPTLSTVASGGTRGDFVAVGPDGCLYATQTSTIVKVTNADGTCSLAPTGAQPQLSLSPASVTPSPSVGTPVTFSASLLNVANPTGRSVTFTVTGANPQTGSALANSSGVAAFTYTAANAGTDTVVATANVGGTPLTSNPGSVTWVRAEPHSLSVSGASTSFAESPTRADLNLTGNWTVELWLRDEDPNGFDHEYRYLINKGDGVAAESPFYLLLGNGSLLAGLRRNGLNNPLTYNLHTAGYNPRMWQHVAATFSADTNTLRLYLNGQKVAEQTLSGHSVGNDLPLEIGRQGPVTGKYWLGKLDDVRIWSVVQSAADIAANYRNQLSGPRSGLVANWHFDEGCGATASDSAGTHAAVLSSAAGWSIDTPSAPQPGAAVVLSSAGCGGGATSTPTPTSTNTPTPTPTSTSTPTATRTSTPTPTNTVQATNTPTSTPTNTLQPTDTPTPTATSANTPQSTDTPTSTPTNTLQPTNTPTSTPTNTPQPTDTPTPTNTPQLTDTPTPTATSTNTPQSTDTPTPTPTNTPQSTETPTPTATATSTATPTSTSTATPTLTNTATPTATNTPTATSTSTPTPISTDTPTPTSTSTPTPISTDTPTPTSTSTATATPTLPSGGSPPTASITAPSEGQSLTAPSTIRGTVSGPANWRLSYTLAGNTSSTTIATGSGPVANAALGTFDPTLLVNGTYSIDLTASNTAGSSTSTVHVAVLQNLKVGNFTLTFTDFHVPVAGIPIQADRNYDSRNLAVGDFGAGWSLGLKSVRLEKSVVLGENWQVTQSGGFFPTYCVVPTKAPNVTVTFPNGKTYEFQGVANPQCQQLVPLENLNSVDFTQLPTTPGTEGASLVALNGGSILVNPACCGPTQLVDIDSLTIYDPTQFRLTTADGYVYVVDQNLGLQSMTDPRGNSLTVSNAGIVHSSGRSLSFNRDGLNRISRITDPAGNFSTYNYNAAGDLSSVVDQRGNTTTFTYNLSHGLLEVTDPLGRHGIRNDYDASGRLLSTTDATGHVMTYSFDPNSRQQLYTDRTGNTSVYTYDANGNTTSITDPNGNVTRATFDAAGHKLTETDQLNQVTSYTYDGRGNMLTRRDNAGNVTTFTYDAHNHKLSERDANGHTTSYAYDATGNMTSATDALNNTTTFTYDAQGNKLTATDPAGHVANFTYDAFGNQTQQRDTLGHTSTFVYDAAGRRTSVRDPLGNTTSTTYDAAGNPLTTQDALGHRVQRSYDLVGNLATFIDPANNTTQLLSNASGLPQQTTAPDGSQVAYQYDPNSNLSGTTTATGLTPAITRNKVGNPTDIAVAPGVAVSYQYDAKGRKIAETDPRGNTTSYVYNVLDKVTQRTDALGAITRYTYDAAGNLLSQTDPNTNTTSYVYDADNRLVRTNRPGGTFLTYTYNSVGDMTSKQDPAGNVTTFTYDSEGNLLSVRDALGSTTAYVYDAGGNLVTMTDALNRTTTYQYDALHHMTRRTYPDNTTEQMTYTATGKLASHIDRKGQTTTYAYDSMDRVATVQYADGSSAAFTYFPGGKRATVVDARGTTSRTYDQLSNLTAETFPGGTTISYTYDAANNRASITTPDGTTQYAYDAAGHMTRVTDPRGLVTTYAYDAAANLTTINRPNAVVTSRTYDNQNRILSVTTRGPASNVLFQETYTRDALGNRTNVVATDGSSIAYTYDALSRLMGETHRNTSGVTTSQVAYTYDLVGNRTTITTAGTTTTLAYNTVDELTSDGTNTYSYDAAGNTAGVSSASGQTTYAYNARNQLVQVTLPDLTTSTAQYDADGNRVQARNGASTVNYVVDSAGRIPNVVVETDALGNILASYTYGVGLISQRRGGVDSFYATDALGSVRLLTDNTGAVTDTYAYGSFGELQARTGTTQNNRLFTGEQLDSAAGLYYLRSRYYNPSAGRFLTADRFAGTESDPRTLNRYAYALDNPINATDPLGLYSTGEGNDIHRLIGEFYLGMWGDYFVDIGRRPNRGFPSIGGYGAYNRGILNGGGSLRPDLRNYLTGDVYEIKPLTPYGVVEGPIDLADYVVALNIFEAGAPTFGFWFPGYFTFPGMLIFPYAGGTVEVFGPPMVGAGLIFYTNNLVRDLVLVGAVASAAVLGILAAQRLIMLAPALIQAAFDIEISFDFGFAFI